MAYSKYRNIKIYKDGKKIADSKKENKRYEELLLLQKANLIKDLQKQVLYELQKAYEINGKHIRPIKYIADFVYFDTEAKKWVIEDVKGIRTDVYKLKKKLFEYKYKMEIKEI